jgi:hypothetical protein
MDKPPEFTPEELFEMFSDTGDLPLKELEKYLLSQNPYERSFGRLCATGVFSTINKYLADEKANGYVEQVPFAFMNLICSLLSLMLNMRRAATPGEMDRMLTIFLSVIYKQTIKQAQMEQQYLAAKKGKNKLNEIVKKANSQRTD